MTAFQAITKSTTEHLGAAQFNRPPLPAKRHGFSPPFTEVETTEIKSTATDSLCLYRQIE